jgi:predicted site-specific integrase-resolvase
MVTDNPSLWTVRQVALFCGVHEVTVRKWIRCGTLAVCRIGPTKRSIRVTASEVQRISGTLDHISPPQTHYIS